MRALDAYKAETFETLFPSDADALKKADVYGNWGQVRGPYVKYKSDRSNDVRTLYGSESLGTVRYDAFSGPASVFQEQFAPRETLTTSDSIQAALGHLPSFDFGTKRGCRDEKFSALVTYFTRKGKKVPTVDQLIKAEQNRLVSYQRQCALLLQGELATTPEAYPRRYFARRLARAKKQLATYLRHKAEWLASARNRLKQWELRPGRDEAKAKLVLRIQNAVADVDAAVLKPHAPAYRYRYINLLTNRAIRCIQPQTQPDFIPLPTSHHSTWCEGLGLQLQITSFVDALGRRAVETLKVNRRLIYAYPAKILGDQLSSVCYPDYLPRTNLLLDLGVETVADSLRRMVSKYSSHETVSVPLFLLEIADLRRTVVTVRDQVGRLAKQVDRSLIHLSGLAAAMRSGRGFGKEAKAWRKLASASGAVAKGTQHWIESQAQHATRAERKAMWQVGSEALQLLSSPIETLKLLSAADLNRKFGMIPAIRDITALLQGISKKGHWYEDALRALKRRGRLQTQSWLINRDVQEQFLDVTLDDMINLPATGEHATPEELRLLNRRISRFVGELREHAPDAVARLHVETVVENRLTFKLSFDYYDALGHPLMDEEVIGRWMLDNLGLNLNLEFAWDHLPYSFVVDWVLDVGKYLGSRTSHRWIKPAVVPYCAMLTRKTTTIVRLLPNGERNWSWGDNMPPVPGSEYREGTTVSLEYGDMRTVFQEEIFERQILSHEQVAELISKAGVTLETSAPSMWQAITWSELLASR